MTPLTHSGPRVLFLTCLVLVILSFLTPSSSALPVFPRRNPLATVGLGGGGLAVGIGGIGPILEIHRRPPSSYNPHRRRRSNGNQRRDYNDFLNSAHLDIRKDGDGFEGGFGQHPTSADSGKATRPKLKDEETDRVKPDPNLKEMDAAGPLVAVRKRDAEAQGYIPGGGVGSGSQYDTKQPYGR